MRIPAYAALFALATCLTVVTVPNNEASASCNTCEQCVGDVACHFDLSISLWVEITAHSLGSFPTEDPDALKVVGTQCANKLTGEVPDECEDSVQFGRPIVMPEAC